MAACLTPRALVGSSRMSTLAPKWTARALAARERSHRLRGVAEFDTNLFQLLAGDPVGFRHIEPLERSLALRWFAPEEEISRDARERDHCQVLVDGGYPAVDGVAWRIEGHLLAV